MGTAATTFIVCLMVFVGIGALSMRRRQDNVEDYLTASHNVPAWLVALSSVVTNNSGYMFVGLIGYTYLQGVSAIWLSLGWILGDWLAWRTLHPRLREFSEHTAVSTIPSLMARSGEVVDRRLTILAALVILAFLSIYAAAQLKAGSMALHVMFGWPLSAGAVIGAVIVVIYCFAGGIRASIWTDAAQAFVMITSMAVLAILGWSHAGWPGELISTLSRIDPALVDLAPDELAFGIVPFVIGWVAAGLGVSGQPHILIRTIALRRPRDIGAARRIYFSWYIPFSLMTVLVGLYCRVLLPDVAGFDPELALPTLAAEFLPGIGVGIVLAGLFAATISTADSMLLSCSAALSQDIFPRFGQSYMRTKVATIVVSMVVLGWALSAPASVFTLVVIAWSALGSTLGPVILVRLAGQALPTHLAALMMTAGLATVLTWRFLLGFSDDVNETLPGLAAGFLVYYMFRPTPKPKS